MPGTTPYSAGDIVLVPFPFSDLASVKKRPALVLSFVPAKRLPSMVIVAMITSRLEGEPLPGDRELSGWKKAGLISPSKVRLSKLVSIEATTVLRRLGSLSDGDRASVGQEIRKLFSPWGSA